MLCVYGIQLQITCHVIRSNVLFLLAAVAVDHDGTERPRLAKRVVTALAKVGLRVSLPHTVPQKQ